MIAGHYAAAFLPAAHKARGPFWLFLLASQIPEFLWLLFAIAGIEPTLPASILDATFDSIVVDMRFSHNLVPALFQAIITGVVVAIVFRNAVTALWSAALVVIHVLCDYVVGFSHQIMWYSSPSIGLNSYKTMPYVAIGIELVFAWICLGYFYWKRKEDLPWSNRQWMILTLAFSAGILAWMPAARIPIRHWLGL
ncbi:MAG TPA: hypothetical protein PKX74_07400 [Leptospiraceae bacterium]|nr:hypothetical protein [Leptospiraceae bacterium]HNJ35087.1 hypothetical protein [Leptospiraceae bacterium]